MKENLTKIIFELKSLGILIIWMASICFIAFINIPTLQGTTQVLGDYSLKERFLAVWVLASDATYYFDIAQNWYSHTSAAFFPMWPIVTKVVGAKFITMEITAIIFTILFFYLLTKLSKVLNIHKKNREKIFLVILVFPASFVLVTPLTEPFFLFLTALTIFFAEKKSYGSAATVAAIASATRPNGFLLGMYIFLKLYQEGIPTLKKYWYTIVIAFSGIIIYFSYLHFAKNDFFLFLKEQQKWNSSLSLKSIIGFFHFHFRFIEKLFSDIKPEPLHVYHFLSFFFFIFLSFFSFGKINRPLWIYSIISVLFPVLSGSYSGLPRYLLAGFPLFIPFANMLIRNKLFFYLYLIISVYFQTYLLLRFINFEAT